MAMVAAIIATLATAVVTFFVSGDIAFSFFAAFAAFGMSGWLVGMVGAADDIARARFTGRGGVDPETRNTLAVMCASFVAGVAYAGANGASETLALMAGAAAMGATLLVVLVALASYDMARQHYTR